MGDLYTTVPSDVHSIPFQDTDAIKPVLFGAVSLSLDPVSLLEGA